MRRGRRPVTEWLLISLLATTALSCGRVSTAPPQGSPEAGVKASSSDRAVDAPTVVTPAGENIHVEVAIDPETRAQGLMFRESLPRGRGMLFLFPRSDIYSFWMKNTLIPLDMIWIDAEGTVVGVEANVPPCQADPCPSYGPDAEAQYVLELGAGEAARYGIGKGTHLDLRNLERFVVR